jgi:hypothetical protein
MSPPNRMNAKRACSCFQFKSIACDRRVDLLNGLITFKATLLFSTMADDESVRPLFQDQRGAPIGFFLHQSIKNASQRDNLIKYITVCNAPSADEAWMNLFL